MDEKPLRVLHIIDTFSMGGVETWLLSLLREWREGAAGPMQMDFIAASGNEGLFDEEVRALGARVFYLRYSRSTIGEFAAGLRELLESGHYDALHDHQGYVSGWHFLLGTGRLPPVRVTHVHNAVDHVRNVTGDRALIGRIGDALVGRYATHIVGTSRRLITECGFDGPAFRHIPKGAIYCGFDVERFNGDPAAAAASLRAELGWPAEAKLVLVAGRIDRSPHRDDPENSKNSAFAVSVAIEAVRRDPTARVLFAGELSAATPILERRIADAGFAERIRFLGIRRDIERLMLGSDVLLFPSRREGLGMVAVEAQAAGLPVLASTDVPAECVVAAELVHFRDVGASNERDWAKELLDLTARARNVPAANARVAASVFSIQRSARNLLNLYRTGELPAPLSERPVNRMRVLHVIDTFSMGGVETWMMELLRRWRLQGDAAPQIDFIAASGNQGIFDDEVRALGGEIHYLRYTRYDVPSFVKGFRRILREGKYAAIHDHQWYTSGWHFLMGHGLLAPVRITHVHNPSLELGTLPPLRAAAAQVGKFLVGKYATHILGTSRQVVTEYGFDEAEFRHIPKAALYCGFDAARFRGDGDAARASLRKEFDWPPEARIVLFAGRIDQSPDLGDPKNHKNSGFAVDVAIEACRRDRRLCMILAGAESPAVEVLKRRIDETGLSGRIRFLGVRRDIEHLMLGSDLLLFPSQGEGLGMVAVEAQAAGLPVLASTGVPREAVVVPDLVRFREIADGAEAWAEDVLALVMRPRDVLAANGRVAASAFSIDQSAAALAGLYRTGKLSQGAGA